jgi:hypothetical protein
MVCITVYLQGEDIWDVGLMLACSLSRRITGLDGLRKQALTVRA